MTKLTEFLSPENVRQGVLISSKKRALELVGKIVAESINQTEQQSEALCPIECFGNLFKREKLGTTGLNQGIALPHAKLPACGDIELTKPIAVFYSWKKRLTTKPKTTKKWI